MATHSSEFSNGSNVLISVDAIEEAESTPYAMTNRGLKMHTILQQLSQHSVIDLDKIAMVDGPVSISYIWIVPVLM
jgi:hypothetical protein